MRKRPSKRAEAIRAKARELGIHLWGDSEWAIAEASMLETPTGLIHLHRMNRFGVGKWSLVSNPRKGICETARCRVVYITPMGGEACEVDQVSLDEIQQAYWEARSAIDSPAWWSLARQEKELLMVGYEVIT